MQAKVGGWPPPPPEGWVFCQPFFPCCCFSAPAFKRFHVDGYKWWLLKNPTSSKRVTGLGIKRTSLTERECGDPEERAGCAKSPF